MVWLKKGTETPKRYLPPMAKMTHHTPPRCRDVYEKGLALQAQHSQMKGEYMARRAELDDIGPGVTGVLLGSTKCNMEKFPRVVVRMSSSSASTATTTTPATSLYERAMKRIEEKHRKILEMEHSMTPSFTPETNTTGISTDGSGSVFERLYNHSKQRQQRQMPSAVPRRYNSTPRRFSSAPRRSETPTHSRRSNKERIEQLYQKGRKQQQSRTDREEAEVRRRRWEERELRHCTFRPNITKPRPTSKLRRRREESADNDEPPIRMVRATTPSRRVPNVVVVSPLKDPSLDGKTRVNSEAPTDYGSI
mmetsp:Transcript_10420/g.24161  ORF Transcript_10420/g.24161 Transcript_10420/m.24161 type:complete len:307 (+) Transcript_10420:83-1003(+)